MFSFLAKKQNNNMDQEIDLLENYDYSVVPEREAQQKLAQEAIEKARQIETEIVLKFEQKKVVIQQQFSDLKTNLQVTEEAAIELLSLARSYQSLDGLMKVAQEYLDVSKTLKLSLRTKTFQEILNLNQAQLDALNDFLESRSN